ncbi:MAG: glycosyltransferase family 39 protein, partial [Crocosphaera sp.]
MKLSKVSRSFYLICFIIILLGIFFRFTNIAEKVYWHDEIFTSLHITGFLSSEWKPQLFTGKIIEPDKLQYYLQINPNKNLVDTLNVLAVEDPHHPPFYYILLRYWRQLFGDSITVIRSFSSVFSLLILPAIYWLCWELFKQPIVAWVSISLISISPFYVLYSQEAREYALWTVLICLSSAALLRCIKLTQYQKLKVSKYYVNWGLYSILTTLSLYTSLFSLFVIIAQVSYTLVLEKLRLTKVVFFQSISLMISVVLFLPWIIVFINNYEQYKKITSWTKEFVVPALDLLKIWGLNI